MKFFNLLYYNLYKNSQKGNAAPEIPVLGIISFGQVFNIITVINVFLILFKPGFNYEIHKLFLVLAVVLFGLNYFHFEKKKVGSEIMADEKLDLKEKSFLTYLYLIFSVFLAGFSYYLLREF